MLLVPDTTLRSLGLGAVIVGLVSIAVALTFHPARLMVLGDRVDRLALPWLGRRIAASAGGEGRGWRRAVGAGVRRPGVSLIAGTAGAAGGALPPLGPPPGGGGGAGRPGPPPFQTGV